MRERILSFIYDSKEGVHKVLNTIVGFSIIVVLGLLIFENGFYLTEREAFFVTKSFNYVFGFFVFQYIVRFLFTFQKVAFLKTTFIELILITFLVITGGSHFFFFESRIVIFISNFIDAEYDKVYNLMISVYMIYFVGFNFVKVSGYLQSVAVQPSTTLAFSFMFLILAGTGMLMLPKMTAGETSASFIDAFFTSVSASCVTGLIVVDTATYFTYKGHVVILFLMQFGGIGIVTFATFFSTFVSKRIGIKEHQMIQDFISGGDLSSAKSLLSKVFTMTLIIELAASIGIFISWGDKVQFESLSQKMFYSLFHGVSAFCNAGFSLFTNGLFENVIRQSTLLHVIIALTIILGGLGFSVIQDLFSISSLRERMKRPWVDWKISTKIAVHATMFLLIIGTVGFYLLEKNNEGTIANYSNFEAMVASFFQSVTTRTAGFNTVDFSQLRIPTIVFFIFLMFIGASSGSTGGGIKTSTFVIIFMSSIAIIRGRKSVHFSGRTFETELLFRAYSVFVFAASFNLLMIFTLSVIETEIPIIQLVFEQISAFSTVGVSTGITSSLSLGGKIIIMISMFIGRVGTLTLVLMLSSRVATNNYHYPKANIMIG